MATAVIARLQDMIEAIGHLEQATQGKTFDDYQRDWLLQRAAERAIEIISEASRRIPADIKQHHPYPRWRDIAGIGNVLRHEYHRVDDKIVWAVVRDELPRLKAHLENMRREVEGEDS